MKNEGEVFRDFVENTLRITQEEAAKKLGVTRATVNNLMNRSKLTEDWKMKIVTKLGEGKNVFTGKESEYTDTVNEEEIEYIKIPKTQLSAMEKLIKSMERHIERLEKEKNN